MAIIFWVELDLFFLFTLIYFLRRPLNFQQKQDSFITVVTIFHVANNGISLATPKIIPILYIL